jgi:hypothetical protein
MATHQERKRAHFPVALLATSVVFSTFLIAPIVATSAHADQNPAPSTTLSPQEQYKFDFEMYLNKLKAREIEMRILNQNFKIAIEKARRDYLTALRSAKGPTDKSLLSAKFDEIKSSAAAQLEQAREELGPIPMPPQEPNRGFKSKINRDNEKKKSR